MPKSKESSLGKLKEQYEALRKSYGLPEFRFMNENFEIEVLGGDESELLLRKIRKLISERISSLLRIMEAFQNPSNAPIFVFNILNSFNDKDKAVVNKLYRELNEVEIEIFGRDIEYDEKKEAEFIKKFCEKWKTMQEDLRKIEIAMKASYVKKDQSKERSYFG